MLHHSRGSSFVGLEGDGRGWTGAYNRLYAPIANWRGVMVKWILSRSYADCHKWINDHDDELVREGLKYDNSDLLQTIACYSKNPPMGTTPRMARDSAKILSLDPTHIVHPLLHPLPTTPPKTVRRRGGLWHLQYRLSVHKST